MSHWTRQDSVLLCLLCINRCCPARQSNLDNSELGKKWTRRRRIWPVQSIVWSWCQKWDCFRTWYGCASTRKVSSCSWQQSSNPVWQTFLYPLFLASSCSTSALTVVSTTTWQSCGCIWCMECSNYSHNLQMLWSCWWRLLFSTRSTLYSFNSMTVSERCNVKEPMSIGASQIEAGQIRHETFLRSQGNERIFCGKVF